MHCVICGLILDGVSKEQMLKTSKHARIKAFCPVHAEQVLGIKHK